MALSIQKYQKQQPSDGGGKPAKSFWAKLNSIEITERKNVVTTDELMFFTAQLSLMMETGTPINRSLPIIAEVVPNPYLKEVIVSVRNSVLTGMSLSQALMLYPDVFNDLYVSLVKAGESSGLLREMLERLVELQKKKERFASEVKSALMYPVFLVFFSITVILFIMIVVFPKFTTMFESIRDELPVTTLVLMSVSNLLIKQWYIILFFLVVLVVPAVRFLKTDNGREWIDRFTFHVPLVKDLIINLYIAQFTRSLGFLAGSSVQLLDSLEICRDSINNSIFKKFITNIIESVTEGRGMSPAFNESSFLPVTVKQMVNTAEETGNLPIVMNRLADYYDEWVMKQLKSVTTLAEPIMLVIMGIVVGTIVISLILPIFQLSKAVH